MRSQNSKEEIEHSATEGVNRELRRIKITFMKLYAFLEQ